MGFKIVVTEFREVANTRREYKQIADSGNEKDGGAVWDYVDVGGVTYEERQVFHQEVGEIDLFQVIKAVNGQPS